MIKQEKSKFKPSWEFFALGVGFVVMGIVMIVQGISAQKTGAIIPATGKSGPMTGTESIVTGVVAMLAGLPFIAYEVYKMYKRKSDNYGLKRGQATLRDHHCWQTQQNQLVNT